MRSHYFQENYLINELQYGIIGSLPHNSLVVFSIDINYGFVHRISLFYVGLQKGRARIRKKRSWSSPR